MLLAGPVIFSDAVLRPSRRSSQWNVIPVTPSAPHGRQEAPPVLRTQRRCVERPDEPTEPLQSSGDRSSALQAASSSADRRPTSVSSGSSSSARQRVSSSPVPAVASAGSQLLQCSRPSAVTVVLFFRLYSFLGEYCMFSLSSLIFAFQSLCHLICYVFDLESC